MKETDDPLETLLQKTAYLDDEGFTARVLERLPPPRNLTRLRALVLIATAVVAGLVALVCLPGSEAVRATLGALGGRWREAPANTLAGLVLAAMIVWACATAAAAD
jgi:hypothetical protein